MKTRKELETIVRELVLGFDLDTHDLLVVIECCAREMAARETVNVTTVRRILEAVLEEEHV
jgi:hypothetical protein